MIAYREGFTNGDYDPSIRSLIAERINLNNTPLNSVKLPSIPDAECFDPYPYPYLIDENRPSKSFYIASTIAFLTILACLQFSMARKNDIPKKQKEPPKVNSIETSILKEHSY